MSPRRRRDIAGPRGPRGEGTVFQRCEPKRGCPPAEEIPAANGKIHRVRPDHTCKGLWIGRIELEDGTRIQVSGRTEAIARRRLAEKKREIAEYGTVAKAITVEAWCREWLDNVAKIRPNTRTQYRSIIKNHILPVIGGRQVRKVEPRDIRAVLTRDELARLTSTRRQAYILLGLLWADAKREGYASRNVVEVVRAPEPKKKERLGPSTDEARALLSYNASSGDRLASRWAAVFYTLQRQGECLGLEWDRVDLDGGALDVSWQLQDLPYKHMCGVQDSDGSWPCGAGRAGSCPERTFEIDIDYEYRQLHGALCLVKPKSKRGERVIPLLDPLRLLLEQRWEMCEAERGSYRSDHGLVWCRPNGLPLTAGEDGKGWKALLSAVGVAPYDLHGGRHTGISLLYEAGVSEPTIQALAGHARKETSHGYAHVTLASMRREMMRAIEQPLAISPA